MSTTASSASSPDRLIWLPLLALMVVALVAGQARANLHAEARATIAAAAAFDASYTAEAWCRMHLDRLTGDRAPGLDRGYGLAPSSASGPVLPVALRLPEGRRFRSVDASL